MHVAIPTARRCFNNRTEDIKKELAVPLFRCCWRNMALFANVCLYPRFRAVLYQTVKRSGGSYCMYEAEYMF